MSSAALPIERPLRRDPLAGFLFVSLLLHALLLLLFPTFYRPIADPSREQLTEVEILPPPLPPKEIAKAEPPQLAPPPPAPVEKPKAEELPKPLEKAQPKPPEPKPQEALPEQIVTPPDQVNDQVPENTRLLSDRNSTAKEQTVAHGFPASAPQEKEREPKPEKAKNEEKKPPVQTVKKQPTPQPPDTPTSKREGEIAPPKQRLAGKPEAAPRPPKQLAMKPPIAQSPPQSSLEKQRAQDIDEESLAKPAASGTATGAKNPPQLFARADELLSKGWIDSIGKDKEDSEERKPPQGRDLIAMAPPPAPSVFSLPGQVGTPDFLPDVRQGNLTFLNTKAHRFAPFVRRVALRVFQHLIIHQRKNLQINDVVAAREYSTIEAKIDTQGNLKKLIIQTRSGSYAVDEALLRACENGAWDENPPPEAIAEDGLIHFIFRSEINAQYDDLGLRGILTTLQVGLV
ncbi:MAG: hypothetical protein AB7G75_34330 [Candidatus Binatia bacterium]